MKTTRNPRGGSGSAPAAGWRFLLPLTFVALLIVGFGGAGHTQPSPDSTAALFRDVAEDVGLKFHHFTGATGDYFMPEIMGAGAAVFDYDNDGDLDVYLVQGTTLAEGKKLLFPPRADWKPGNRLFRNMLTETGKLEFVDVTEQARVGFVGYGMGAAVADYDNDGNQDLYVTNFGRNVLYHNNGDGTFTDVTEAAGVDDVRWSTGASWLDFDGDGFLDLYVANYVDFTVKGSKQCFASTGELDYCTPRIYRPTPDRLFRNLGDGKFADVTLQAGIGSAVGFGLGVVSDDFNADGLPDIYVANDSTPNFLWINQGNGTFKESGLVSGTAYNAAGIPQAGMGVATARFHNTAAVDLLVTNLTHEGCNLFLNDGKGNFYDAASEYGLLQATFPNTGFGTQWFDYDNDGLLDLFIANGAVTRLEGLRGDLYPFHQNNQLFHNDGQGKRLREVTSVAGPVFALSEVSRGAAFGDLDNDGDVDIVVTNNNGPVRLLRNETNRKSKNQWIEFSLEESGKNRFALGAEITLREKGGRTQYRRVHSDGSYLASSDKRVHFGLGEVAVVESVLVRWPDGTSEEFNAVKVCKINSLVKGTGKQVEMSRHDTLPGNSH